MIDVAGKLYGTAATGGAFDAGTLFSVNETTGAEETLYSFTGGRDGGYPVGSLIEIDGAFYGTTAYGGVKNKECELGCGTVFKFQP